MTIPPSFHLFIGNKTCGYVYTIRQVKPGTERRFHGETVAGRSVSSERIAETRQNLARWGRQFPSREIVIALKNRRQETDLSLSLFYFSFLLRGKNCPRSSVIDGSLFLFPFNEEVASSSCSFIPFSTEVIQFIRDLMGRILIRKEEGEGCKKFKGRMGWNQSFLPFPFEEENNCMLMIYDIGFRDKKLNCIDR